MTSAKMTSKGQVTIPKEVRDRLGVHPGDRIAFEIRPDGTARMLPLCKTAADVSGILKRAPRRRFTVEEMDQAVASSFRKARP